MFRHGYAPCDGRHRRQVVPQIGRQLCGVYCGQPIPEDLGDGKGAISGGASTSGLAPAGPAARCRSPCAIHLSCGPNPGSSGTVLARDPAPHRAAICWRAIFGAPNDGGGPSFCKPIQILPELLPTDFGPPLLDGERTARARARVRIKEPGREKCRRQVGDLIRQQKPRLAGESPGYANTPA